MSVASPYSTGGGGYSYEHHVGAYFLAHLLRGTDVIGIGGAPNCVKFQQSRSGNPLDDIVVRVSDGQKIQTMYVQVRSKITVSKNNAAFADIIRRCYREFTDDGFNKESDRLCIIVPHYAQNVRSHFIPISDTARSSNNAAEFFKNIFSSAHSQKKHDNVKMIRELLDCNPDMCDNELWMFLKTFNIISLDIDNDDSHEFKQCIELCSDMLGADNMSDGKKLFDRLVRLSGEFSKNSAVIDWKMLKEQLADFAIGEPRWMSVEIDNLLRHSENVTESIRDTIEEKLTFLRSGVMQKVENSIRDSTMLVLTGQPYVGKSAVLKRLAGRLSKHGTVVVFSIERMTGMDLESFLRKLGIKSNFENILHALPQPCYVLIDGFDKLPYNNNKITIVRELLSQIQSYNNQKNRKAVLAPCKIVTTCRTQELESVQSEILSGLNFKTNLLEVMPLSDTELKHIGVNKELGSILEKEHLIKILKIPGYLHILRGGLKTDLDDASGQITESWICRKFWEVMVMRSGGLRPGRGNAHTRAMLVKRCGEASLEGSELSDVLLSRHQDEVDGLVSDKILRRVSDTVVLDSDVFEDYALVEIIKDRASTIQKFLSGKEKSGKLRRSFNLYVSEILEVDCSAEQYYRLLQDVSADESLAIWRHECMSALVMSGSLPHTISKMREFLLQDKSALLAEVVRTLNSVAWTTTPPSMVQSSNHAKNQNADAQSIPLHEKWDPVIEFILDEFEALDDSLILEFCKNIAAWMVTSPNNLLKSRVGLAAIGFFEKNLEDHNYTNTSLSYTDYDLLNRWIITTVIFATGSIRDQVNQFLSKYALGSHESIFEYLVLRSSAARLLCEHLPEITSHLMGEMMCRQQPRPKSYKYGPPLNLGLGHFYQVPTPYEGPFFYFLQVNPKYGLQVINRIVNHATDMWKLERVLEKRQPLPQTIQISGKTVCVYGDETVYGWFRPGRAPLELTIVLMALERWMDIHIENGTQPAKLFEIVLANTNSVSVVGVCVTVALKHHSVTLDAALPFLSNPAFWHMDHERCYKELQMNSLISIYGMFDHSDKTKKSCDILRKQTNQIHRQRHMGSLVTEILFIGSDEINHKLQKEMMGFVGKIPYFFKDEKTNTKITSERRRNCELWFEQTKKENYRLAKTNEEDLLSVEFDSDKHLTEEEKSDKNSAAEYIKLNRFMIWAEKFNSTAVPPDGFTVNSALEYVESFDRSFESSPDDHKQCMINARAHFIGALVAHKWGYILNRKGEQWCLDQIDRILNQNYPEASENSLFPYAINRAIARILPYILLRFPRKKNFKNDILKHSRTRNTEILQCLFTSLSCLWNVDDKLVLKCMTNVINAVKDEAYVRDGAVYAHTDKLVSLLCVFPSEYDISSRRTRQKITKILEHLLKFTLDSYLAANKKRDHNEWHLHGAKWNMYFFSVICMIVSKCPEENSALLDTIDHNWQECREIMIDFMTALLVVMTSTTEVSLLNIWQKYFQIIMNSDVVKNAFSEDEQINKILGLAIFVNPHNPTDIKTLHNYTDMLTEHIDVWCQHSSHIPDCLSHLVAFLCTTGKHVLFPHGVRWLHIFAFRLDKNGYLDQKINVLSNIICKIWNDYKNNLQKESPEYTQFIEIVDLLAINNDPQAEIIRNELHQ